MSTPYKPTPHQLSRMAAHAQATHEPEMEAAELAEHLADYLAEEPDLAEVPYAELSDAALEYAHQWLDECHARQLGLAHLAAEEEPQPSLTTSPLRALPVADRDRLAAALAFYLERCTWRSHDLAEQAEYQRLLRQVSGEQVQA